MKYVIRKFTSVFLTVIMLLAIMPVMDISGFFKSNVTVKAKEVFTSGYCGNTRNGKDGRNLSWVLDESTGKLTVSGNGEMTDDSPFKGDLRIRSVVIETGVTNIGYAAFADCTNLMQISISDTVKSIGDPYEFVFHLDIVGAFENCTKLQRITIPEGVTNIYSRNFYNCKNLSEVNLPSTITTIQYYAFALDKNLKKIEFPSSLNTIGEKVFSEAGLTSVDLPTGLTTMGQFAFELTNITEIHIPGTLQNWDRGGFYSLKQKVEKIVIDEGIKKIPEDTFNFSISGFSEMTIPNSVQTIGVRALSITGLETVKFGKNFRYENNIFVKETTVTNVEISSENTYCHSYDNVIYNSDYSDVLWCNFNRTGTVTFPKELKSFTIKPYETDFKLYTTFNNIVEFDIEDNAENFIVLDGVLYSKDMKELYCCPPKYDKNVTIPDSVENVSDYAFYKFQKSIVLPSKLKRIGKFSFYEVKTFDELTLPDTLIYIGEKAFAYAKTITTLELPDNLETIGAYAFLGIRFDSVKLPDSLSEIDSTSFTTKVIYIGSETKIIGNKAIASMGINISPDNPYYASYDGAVFSKDLSELIIIPTDKYTVEIPKETNKFNTYPTIAINVVEENPYYSSYDGALYSKDRSELKYVPSEKTSMVIPKETKKSAVIISNSIKVTVDTDNPYWKTEGPFLMNKSGSVLYRVEDTSGDLIIPPGVKTMEYLPGTKAGYMLNFHYDITSITYPEGFKTLYYNNPKGGGSQYMVRDCNKVKEITIPGSVDIVDNFWRMDALEKVNIGEGVQEVSNFESCWKLKNLTLPASVKYYEVNLTNDLQNTSELQNLTIKNPHCIIKEQARIKSSSTISGYCGSTAHNLAKKRKAMFKSLGHSYLDWYTKTPATYDSEGVECRDCAYCEHSESRPIPKLVKSTHTATFMADGKEVSKVEFTEAMHKIEEPPVPAKDRYLGEWEPYTLGDDDIVINANYTLIKSDDASDVDADSKIEYYYNTDDVLFNIKASSKAKTVKSTVSQSIPLDIVLVVDQSGSMDEKLGGTKKKVDALKEAAKKFVNQVYENAKNTNADHRIAIAGFGLANGYYTGYEKYENTELLTNSKGAPIVYPNIKPADYATALFSVKNKKDALEGAVDSIQARGATAADLGLEMAKSVYANNDSTDRERVVIFMTDGEPTYSSSFQMSVANSAIDNARILKNTYGATIYSLGVFDNSTTQIDRFMNAVSSDYPNATSYNSIGKSQSDSYYMTVTNTEALSDVFKTITTESLSHTAAFDKLTIIKTLSQYVTLTSSQEQDLRVSLIRQYGITNDDIKISRNENGTTEIKVENLTPYEVKGDNDNYTYEASMSFFASLNKNASSAGEYTVDTEDSGVILGSAAVYEKTFNTSSITLDSEKSRVVYKINNEVYDICENGATPDTDFPADWTFSGWTGSGSEKTATLTKPNRKITWNTANGDVVQTYKEGEFITPPSVSDKSETEKFLSWNKSIPTTMPDNDLEFEAVYGGHIHKYISEILKPANCEEDGIVKYTCDCGDTYMESVEKLGHHYEAVTASTEKDYTDSSRCTFVCSNCGTRYSYALNYQVREPQGWLGWSRMLFEFNLADDNLENASVQPDGTINIRIPLNELQYQNAKNVYVTRTEGSRRIQVPAEIEDGYLVIKANHFSPYEINFVGDDTYITSKEETINLNDTFDKESDDILAVANGYNSLSNFRLLGVQKKGDETSKSMRFVSVVNTKMLRDADEYGYLVAKTTSDKITQAQQRIGEVEFNNQNVAKIKCGKNNKISGKYGLIDEETNYKYVTMAIDDVPDEAALMVRFYVKKGDNIYYPDYTNKLNETLDGCAVSWAKLNNA